MSLSFPSPPFANDSIFDTAFWEKIASQFIRDLALYSAVGTVIVAVYWAACVINRGNQSFQSQLKYREKELDDKRWGWGSGNRGWGNDTGGWGGGDDNPEDALQAGGNDQNGVQGEIDGVHPQPLVVQDDPLPEVDIGILQVDEEAA